MLVQRRLNTGLEKGRRPKHCLSSTDEYKVGQDHVFRVASRLLHHDSSIIIVFSAIHHGHCYPLERHHHNFFAVHHGLFIILFSAVHHSHRYSSERRHHNIFCHPPLLVHHIILSHPLQPDHNNDSRAG